MKRTLLIAIAAAVLLALVIPVSAAGASFIKPENKEDGSSAFHEQILKIVETYAPEQLSRWKEELKERNDLRSKMKDMKQARVFHKKHEQMKEEWQKKIDNGEITREEAKKLMEDKHKAFKEKRKQWQEEGKQLNNQLTQAVEKGNKEEVAQTLNAMLDRLSKANDMMAERLQANEDQG